MESSTIEGVHTSMNTSRGSTSSSVLKKSTTANLSTHGTDSNGSHTSLGSSSQRVRIKRKHLKERSSPFEGGQRSPREDTENIPPALPATLPKDYEEIAQRLAESIHSRVKDVPHRTGSASPEVPDIHTTDTSRFDPGKHSLSPKQSGKSTVPSERETGQVTFKLKQGQATHKEVYSHSVDSVSDVRVTQFAAGQKRKVMKESLSKRSEQMGPVRRVFEPRYVSTSSSDKTKQVTHDRDEMSQVAASTAAAVAATAPLIKYQYDLENKVSLILEKLQHLESASVRSNSRGQHPEVAAEQLQRRLDELTQVKLKELEKLQFQQQHVEVLEYVPQKRSTYSTPAMKSHFKHSHPSSSPERIEAKGKELRNRVHVSAGIRKEKLTPDAHPLRTAPERGMAVASRNPQIGGLPMGYPEPLGDSSQTVRMIQQPLQATKHVKYAPAVHLHKGPQNDIYEHSANNDLQKHGIPDSKEVIFSTKTSPLDTPAPRKYAPVPHSKNTRTRPNGGLLEEILSSQGEAIRQKSPDRSYIEGISPPSQNPATLEESGMYHSQVEKQADSLLTEIASLRKDISKKIKGRRSPQATSSKSPKRFLLEPSSSAMFQNQPQIVTPETRKDAERELQRWQEKRLAPPPLNEYMRKPYHPPAMTTPPSRPVHTSNIAETHVHTSRAPGQPSSAIIQAETLLKRVQTSRKYLESNLEVIQRSKREQEFQEVIESMYADGDAAERTQIKLLVDDYIALIDSQVKEELLHYRSNLAFSPPTKLPPDKHQKPLASETSKTSKPAKKKISAKIDTGLRKPKEVGDGKPIKDITAAGNETREKPKEKKSVTKRVSTVSSKFPVKDFQDDRYLSNIYGRNLLQQSQRTTLRDAPYLRIANQSPQTKRQRMSPKKDANKHTTHTQTPGSTTEKKVSLLRQFPSHTLPFGGKQNQSYTFQNYLNSPEVLRETAIPLGEPRVGGERTEPMVIFNQLDIPPTNQLKQNNVAVISMVTQKPQLEIKHLPPVDIDTEVSSTSEDHGVPVHPPPQIEEIKTQDLLADQYPEHKEQDTDSDDIPESSDVLSFQGYRDYTGEYHGPPFPPQTPHQHHERRSEDIAGDLERKGLLEHRAMEWIEQELMAKMISEFHSRLSPPEERTDSPESDKHDPVDAIGSGGLQLFVDVGQPVNPGLVSSLVKEVLEEDIAKMLGQHLRNLSGEDTNIPATDQRPHPLAGEVSHHALVHTPEVTPPHSPYRSPSPVLHEGQIKTPEPTASDISQEAELESEKSTPEETDNLIQAPTSPVGTPPVTPPPSKGALTPEPGHVETPPPSFHENPPLLMEDTGTVGTPSLTIEESPPVSPAEVKETPQQSPIPPLPLEPEVTPSPTLPPSPQREVTPPPSTQSSSSSTTEDITATETSGREISAGEWLISQQSVGQVPKALMQGTFLDGTSLQDGGEASQTTSSDTLVETEELENEVAQDEEEGEIRGDVQLDDIRDPMVAILTKLNQLPGGYHIPGQAAQGITQVDPSSSPGEISEGQRPVMAPGVEEQIKRIGAGDDTGLPQSPGEVNLPKEGDNYNREPGETPRIIAQGKTELSHKDSTLRLSQLNSRSSSSDNSEKTSARDHHRGRMSSDEGGGGEKEPVLGLQIGAPRIIQVGSHQSPREEESPKRTDPADGRQPNLDLFGTHTMTDRDIRPRTLTPDAINMEALLQSGYLSQTFSQSDGGPPMGSLVGQRGTFGGNESGGTLRQTGGALGTTFGTTMTEDSLEAAAAKRIPEELQQKKVSITLPSTSNIEEEKLDWSLTESEVGNQTVSDVSEISAGDL